MFTEKVIKPANCGLLKCPYSDRLPIAALNVIEYLVSSFNLLMKNLIILLFGSILLTGCKKTVESIAQDLVVQAMINGQWVITRFIQNGNDITSSFSVYKFQYYSDKTVDAFKNGIKERTGNWEGNATSMTTWADFPGAPSPISLINGTWNITKNSWIFVEATQITGSEIKTLRLEKL